MRASVRAVAALSVLALSTCAEPTAPAPQVGSVEVSGASATLIQGQTLQLSAVVRSTESAVLTDRTVVWGSNATGTATVSGSGLVTAVAPGPVTITATADGVVGSYPMTILPIPVADVDVSPPSATIIVGATQQLAAVTKDAGGNTLGGRLVTWQSAATGTATVSGTGLVTGVAPGTVYIRATSEGVVDSAQITVNPIPVASVAVSPPLDTLHPTQTVQLAAEPRDAGGAPLLGRTVTWGSADTLRARVSATGIVTAVGNGSVQITATSEGIVGSATIVVVPVPVATVVISPPSDTVFIGATAQLAAETRDSTGAVLVGRTISWTSTAGLVATVASDGLVTGTGAGTALIIASSEGRADTASILVTPVPVDSVAVSPPTDSLHPTQTAPLTATLFDSTGAVLTGRVVTWSSLDTTVATVDASGLVTAVAVGTATITATSEGVSGNAVISVLPVPVSYVDLTPANPIILVGTTTQLSATPRDSTGGALARAVTWASLDTMIATVTGSGLVTGVRVGFIGIAATSEGKTSSSVVDVNPVPVDSLFLSPARDTILVGTTVQLSVTAFDSTGAVLTGRDVNWGSLTNASASVNASGLVTGHAAGTELIRAHVITTSARGISVVDTITAHITVLPVPVDSISIRLAAQNEDLAPFTTVYGATTPLVTYTYDSIGGQLHDRQITWSSSDSSIVQVSSTGVITATVTGGATGSAYVIAAADNGRDSVLVTSRVLNFTEVHAGPGSSCGLTTAGEAWCWGYNAARELGVDSIADTTLAIAVSGGHTFTKLTVSGKYTSNFDDGGYACGIATGGALYCWGNNYRGQLGIGTATTTPYASPQLVSGGLSFTDVSAGFRNACGITVDSLAYCWGLNELTYAVGDGTQTNRHVPTLVAGGHKWIAISAGSDYACGLIADSTAHCWGGDVRGQLGNGSTPPAQCSEGSFYCTSPAPVVGGLKFKQISAGHVHSCGIATDDKTYCWGHNVYGQLGRGTISAPADPGFHEPQEVTGGHTFAYVSAQGDFTCALTAAGAAFCWGVNGNYESGNGTQTISGSPVAVVGAPPMSTVTSRGGNAIGTCGMSTDGKAWCWGGAWYNRGIGTRTLNPASLGPTKVLGQP